MQLILSFSVSCNMYIQADLLKRDKKKDRKRQRFFAIDLHTNNIRHKTQNRLNHTHTPTVIFPFQLQLATSLAKEEPTPPQNIVSENENIFIWSDYPISIAIPFVQQDNILLDLHYFRRHPFSRVLFCSISKHTQHKYTTQRQMKNNTNNKSSLLSFKLLKNCLAIVITDLIFVLSLSLSQLSCSGANNCSSSAIMVI